MADDRPRVFLVAEELQHRHQRDRGRLAEVQRARGLGEYPARLAQGRPQGRYGQRDRSLVVVPCHRKCWHAGFKGNTPLAGRQAGAARQVLQQVLDGGTDNTRRNLGR